MATTKKQVQIIGRVEFKCDPRKVVYLARSSNGTSQYETSLFDGKATSCTCPARKPCYHMTQLETIEAARTPVASETVVETTTQVVATSEVAPEVEQFDGSRQITAEEWKAILKADKARQQAWQNEYRAKVKEAAAIDRRGYKSALAG